MALHDASFGVKPSITEWGNDRTRVSISQKLPEYIRKIFYHNFTYTDVYIVDRSNRAILIPGKGPDGETNTGFKVKIEREFTTNSATKLLESIENIGKVRDLTDDEENDLIQLSEQLNKGNRCIRIEKSIVINLAELNNGGYYYCSELDCIIYDINYPKEKVFPYDIFNRVKFENPQIIEKPVFSGNFDIVIIDNERTYDQVFSRVFGQVIKIPVVKDPFNQSGIYIKINNANKTKNKSKLSSQLKEMKGVMYDFYELDKLSDLGLYTNQTEAINHERLTNEKMIELENIRHDNRVLALSIENLKKENEALKAQNERESNELDKEKRRLDYEYKSKELAMTENHKRMMNQIEMDFKTKLNEKDLELRAIKTEFEKYKMEYSLETQKAKANKEIELIETKTDYEVIKMRLDELSKRLDGRRKRVELDTLLKRVKREDERQERKHNLDMALMRMDYELKAKDQVVKEVKLDNDLLNAITHKKEEKYRDITEATKATSGIANVLSLGLGLLGI